MTDESKLRVDKFNGQNSQLWKVQKWKTLSKGFMEAIGRKNQELGIYVK